jgi:8-oxo-dGTP pyrophosphatase MutT (NUDIX family)
MRHIRAINNATRPGAREPSRLAGTRVGWICPRLADTLCLRGCERSANGISLQTPADLPALAHRLAAEGWFTWRGEAFDVRADTAEGPVLSTIDRGALPLFGIVAEGVHLNGLVRRPDGLYLWVAKRSATKALDPSKLDHVVAGGIAAGMSPLQTLVKEAQEEAGMPAALAMQARHAGLVCYTMPRAEGLRRDRLHCFDLVLPETFTPEPQDGEVESFACWPLPKVFETVKETDAFKFNVNLVLIDLLLRLGFIEEDSLEGRALRTALAAQQSIVT